MATISVSISTEMFMEVQKYRVQEHIPYLSGAAQRLMKLGLIYLKIMEEEELNK